MRTSQQPCRRSGQSLNKRELTYVQPEMDEPMMQNADYDKTRKLAVTEDSQYFSLGEMIRHDHAKARICANLSIKSS
jgi:hypothetical protein